MEILKRFSYSEKGAARHLCQKNVLFMSRAYIKNQNIHYLGI